MMLSRLLNNHKKKPWRLKMDEAMRIRDKIWYRKIMRTATRQQLKAELQEKIERGDITVEEAEAEWQDYMHRGENTFQGVYGW